MAEGDLDPLTGRGVRAALDPSGRRVAVEGVCRVVLRALTEPRSHRGSGDAGCPAQHRDRLVPGRGDRQQLSGLAARCAERAVGWVRAVGRIRVGLEVLRRSEGVVRARLTVRHRPQGWPRGQSLPGDHGGLAGDEALAGQLQERVRAAVDQHRGAGRQRGDRAGRAQRPGGGLEHLDRGVRGREPGRDPGQIRVPECHRHLGSEGSHPAEAGLCERLVHDLRWRVAVDARRDVVAHDHVPDAGPVQVPGQSGHLAARTRPPVPSPRAAPASRRCRRAPGHARPRARSPAARAGRRWSRPR